MPLLINGQSVEDALIESEFAQIKAYYERLGNVSCCERDPEFRQYARDNIIARVLLSQEAGSRLGPLPAADVEKALAAIAEPHGGEAGFLAALGATPDQLDLIRHDVEADLRVKRMIDTLADEQGPVDDAALKAFHAAHPELFTSDEAVRASHIMKSSRRGEDRQSDYDKLRLVRQQLLEGGDFDELARQHSDKASEHIDLNFFKRGEIPEELEAVAFSMNVGEVSPVFLSGYGFHLLKLTDRRAPTLRPFEEVREDVLRELQIDRRQQVTRQLVEELKRRAVIQDTTPAHAHG